VARDGTVLYQTGAVESVLGQVSGRPEGQNLAAWVEPSDEPILRALCQTTSTHRAELHLRHSDGSLRDCEVHATSLLEDPAWRGVVLTIRDITDRRRLELELRLAQKLESVGQLASGIAHEINTPIQYVSSSVHYLETAFADLERLQLHYGELRDVAQTHAVSAELLARIARSEEEADLEYLRERVPQAIARSLDGLGRVTKIVAAMRAFGRVPTDTREPVDINEAIRTTLAVAVGEYKYLAEVQASLGEIPPALANGGDINQVLLNLIVNAAHAIEDVVGSTGDRGTITIETYAAADQLVITVADTGCGIPDGIAERVFDPFFTTKEVGRGTGQGLAISRNLIERHEGQITFHSQPGQGTTFTIRLPRLQHSLNEPIAA
jgi:PAS domain S-box-containing protein